MHFNQYTMNYENGEEVAHEIEVDINQQDVRKLASGEYLHTSYEEFDISIFPPTKAEEPYREVGHYDDVLIALEEMFYLIEDLEDTAPNLIDYTRKEKIKNTYKHYKEQQERYQQTNK